jgi:hypothetical protein
MYREGGGLCQAEKKDLTVCGKCGKISRRIAAAAIIAYRQFLVNKKKSTTH